MMFFLESLFGLVLFVCVLPVPMEVCLGSTLFAGKSCSVFCLCRWDVPPSVFLMWEATLWE